jgi:hypothetical protein
MSIFYYLSKKCEILFKNLLLNLPFFIFSKKKIFENLVFLTDTVADLAVRYTLCGRYTLCAHCILRLRGMTLAYTETKQNWIPLLLSRGGIGFCSYLYYSAYTQNNLKPIPLSLSIS